MKHENSFWGTPALSNLIPVLILAQRELAIVLYLSWFNSSIASRTALITSSFVISSYSPSIRRSRRSSCAMRSMPYTL